MDIVLERVLSLIPRKEDGKFVHGAKKEFADRLGLSHNLVTMWEKGQSTSYRTKLHQIASTYNVSVEWLKGETDKKEKPTETNLDELLPGFDDLSEENKVKARDYIEMLLKLQQT